MNLFGKLFGGITLGAVLIGIIPALTPDEDFSPEAQQWLEMARAPSSLSAEQNRFYAEVGLFAAADTDFIGHGELLVQGVNRTLQANQFDFDPRWNKPELGVTLELDGLDFDVISDDPLPWLAQNQAQLDRLITEHATLLERYRALIRMPDYAFTMTPDFRTPLPAYGDLTRVHRLASLQIANAILSGDAPLSALQQQINAKRNALRQSATLLEKLINASMLRFDLPLYAALMKNPQLAAQHQTIASLNDSERTLRTPYVYEFASTTAILEGELLDDSMTDFENFMVSLYLKPRKLANHALEHTWKHMLSLEAKPLAERSHLEAESTYSWWEIYLDPVGYLLYEISRPSYTYHSRLEHLDGLITLVNTAAEINQAKLSATEIPAYIASVDAGSSPGYRGATLTYDASLAQLGLSIPGYDPGSNSNPLEQPATLTLR